MRIAMVGLGRMGGDLSRRLMAGGHEVVVNDLDAAAIDDLVADGRHRRAVAHGPGCVAARAANRLGDGAGRGDRPGGRRGGRCPRARRRDHRRRQLELERRPDPECGPRRRGGSLSSTSAPPAACTAGSGATA